MTLGVGIHDAVPPEAYHSDPCAEISLSRSGIQTILTGTLADFASKHPKLTQWPELMRESTDATDIGEVAHAMILGVGSKFVVKDSWDFTAPKTGKPYETWSGDAKTWRDDQRARGMIVIGRETNAMAMQITAKLDAVLRDRFGAACWAARKCEQTVIWQRRLNDGSSIWCRARLDALLPDGTIIDVKTTALSLSDVELGRTIALKGWDVQHAFYQDGVAAVECATNVPDGNPAIWTAPPFIFACIQTVPPYAVRLVNLDGPKYGEDGEVTGEAWPLSMTRMDIDVAAHRFGAALKSGVWAGDPIDGKPQPPRWWVEQKSWKLMQAGLLAEEG